MKRLENYEKTEEHTEGSTENIKTTDIKEIKNVWFNVRVEVTQIWENKSNKIRQVGLCEDNTGKVKFVNWKTSKIPELREGNTYLLKNVAVSEYKGNKSINFNKNTEVYLI